MIATHRYHLGISLATRIERALAVHPAAVTIYLHPTLCDQAAALPICDGLEIVANGGTLTPEVWVDIGDVDLGRAPSGNGHDDNAGEDDDIDLPLFRSR
jgi:hypothetical protein